MSIRITPRGIILSLFSLLLFSSINLSLAESNCTNGLNVAGFACDPRCPSNPPAGKKYLSLNCRCKKDRNSQTCTPSGVCSIYTIAGKDTGVKLPCKCGKFDTAPLPGDESIADVIE